MCHHSPKVRACFVRFLTQLTQASFAKRVHTDQTVISRIERGNVSVGVDLLQRIVHALGAKITVTIT
ncbi:MAG: helix-turn-helix transcriptional regulator [Magnetococcales bacterium]|nr:helix-turn-helix transcriptional regulator [Magnetococcales bacterium]